MLKYVIDKLYEKYSDQEIFFSKNIQNYINLETQNTYLKIGNDQWNCYIYTCSMKEAKIVINLNRLIFDSMKNSNNNASLRLSFKPPEEKDSIAFFVSSKIQGYKLFSADDKNSYLVTLSFIQKPSEYLINVLGDIASQNENIEKRKDERISITNENIKQFGLTSNNVSITIDKIERICLLRNISSSGAVVLISGFPKFMVNKKIMLLLKMKNNNLNLNGSIVRYNEFIQKKALYELAIEFSKENLPINFIKILNEYFDSIK
jgi:hypothetical protein